MSIPVSSDGPIALITLDRPDALNALTAGARRDIPLIDRKMRTGTVRIAP